MSRRPPSRAVFWRRRFLLLAGVLAIAWAMVSFRPGGSEGPAPTAAPTPTATASPEPAPTVGAQESLPQVTIEAGSASCDPEQVRIVPVVPSGQRAGEAVAVDLLLSTTQEQACTLKPGEADIVAVVRDGDVAVWDSSVCRAPMLESSVGLSPRWSTLAPSGWDGRGSGAGCSGDEGSVGPGTYTLQIGTLGGEPGRVRFELGAKPSKDEDADDENADDE